MFLFWPWLFKSCSKETKAGFTRGNGSCCYSFSVTVTRCTNIKAQPLQKLVPAALDLPACLLKSGFPALPFGCTLLLLFSFPSGEGQVNDLPKQKWQERGGQSHPVNFQIYKLLCNFRAILIYFTLRNREAALVSSSWQIRAADGWSNSQ